MTTWLLSANPKRFDHIKAFDDMGFIDWRQLYKYDIGDIVYIYMARPYKKIMFKTIVERINIPYIDKQDDTKYWYSEDDIFDNEKYSYCRLKLLSYLNTNDFSLDFLLEKKYIKSAPQVAMKINNEEFINTLNSTFVNDSFEEEITSPSKVYEGAIKQILVNKYERSNIARKKCIELNGVTCAICGFNFEEKYGNIGKNYIHVHHKIPISEIKKEYLIDYKNDLIPVCPNCHAMLHRNINGKNISIEELKHFVESQREL
jgi:5-methylcytosine-specific restriction protein A